MTILTLLVLLRGQILPLRGPATLALKLATTTATTTVTLAALSSRHAAVSLLGLALALVLRTRLRVGDRARDCVGRFIYIEVFLDGLRNRLDLGTKLLLDPIQIEPVLPVDQVNRQTQMSKSTRATDAVQVCLSILGEVEVDNNVDGLDINTTSQQVRADKVTTHAVAEVVEHTITVVLQHPGVRIEARIPKLGDLLSE